MNDPNGLVYLNGTYHLFYQYNPNGSQWGFMSWGHATSNNLVNWQEQSLAIRYAPGGTQNPGDVTELIFSGSAIVDSAGVAGFGTNALLAYYTSHYPSGSPAFPNSGPIQAQSLAYSSDEGVTWTKYSGNPVIDVGAVDFRDPKVFKFSDGGNDKWVMVIATGPRRTIELYESTNLLDWTPLSEFGPAGAVMGAWEVPDLFPLDADGDPNRRKWVLLVSIGDDGRPNGGSRVQYFIGDFDGTRFVADNAATDPSAVPGSLLYEDFESGYSQWTPSGTAFGSSPANGTLPNQQIVAGYLGDSLVNSFLNGDSTTGTLTSDPFVISQDFINFKLGGGNHPATDSSGATTFNLLVDGSRVRSATGANDEFLIWQSFDVAEYIGMTGSFEIVDANTGGWGHINVDHVWFSSQEFGSNEDILWADFGADYYAPITFSNMPDQRRVAIGWANNWRYAGSIPTSTWRGSQGFGRELSLVERNNKLILLQKPVSELAQLRRSTALSAANVDIDSTAIEIDADGFNAEAIEVDIEIDAGSASEFGMIISDSAGGNIRIGYDAVAGRLFIDRAGAGNVAFNPGFPARHEGPLVLDQGRLQLKVIVDWSMIEVFGNDGEIVLADRVFLSQGPNTLELFSTGGRATVVDFKAWELQSVW